MGAVFGSPVNSLATKLCSVRIAQETILLGMQGSLVSVVFGIA